MLNLFVFSAGRFEMDKYTLGKRIAYSLIVGNIIFGGAFYGYQVLKDVQSDVEGRNKEAEEAKARKKMLFKVKIIEQMNKWQNKKSGSDEKEMSGRDEKEMWGKDEKEM